MAGHPRVGTGGRRGSGRCGRAGAQVIVEKMLEYLRAVTDDVAKGDVVQRISDLAERYAPDTFWFIETMNRVRCRQGVC